MIVAGLGQIALRGDTEPRAKRLQQNRHQVRKQNDAEQRVTKSRSAGQIGRPVSRIHVTDGYEVSRSGECQNLPPPPFAGDGNGSVDLDQRWSGSSAAPSGLGRGLFVGRFSLASFELNRQRVIPDFFVKLVNKLVYPNFLASAIRGSIRWDSPPRSGRSRV